METRATLEVIADTVEEAVEKGLQDLNLPAEAVEVEILDEGSRGLFGLGSRQARVRLSIKPTDQQPIPDVTPVEPTSSKRAGTAESKEVTDTPAPGGVSDVATSAEIEQKKEYALRVARETVFELLLRMDIQAELDAYYGEADTPNGREPLCVDIQGDDLSILIGRRAETLNALQYMTHLIIGKELGHAVPLVVDVQGYRKRREKSLRQLAHRMAEQAVKTGKRQSLEPMPANERRIIHIELRKNPAVITESVGEDPRRKVTIRPV